MSDSIKIFNETVYDEFLNKFEIIHAVILAVQSSNLDDKMIFYALEAARQEVNRAENLLHEVLEGERVAKRNARDEAKQNIQA